MSKLTRTLMLGATLTAINLVGMTAIAIAHAQANDQPAGTQAARRPPTERQVGESWRHRHTASKEQTAADATLQRVQARERLSIPSGTPAQAPAPVRSKSTGQPRWLIASLAVLVALALCGGLAVTTTRRARRRTRVGHAT
jgi:hypothetical protein